MASKKVWLPLESDPELLNQFLVRLGARGPLQFHDVFGFDDELLAMVPQPVRAALLLFPITEASEAAKKEEEEKGAGSGPAPDGLFYMKQRVGNACGTIAMVHAVANLRDEFELEEGKFFANFLDGTKGMDANERADALGESRDLEEGHEDVARQGGSAIPQNVNLHFVAFVRGPDGALWELDGRKAGPISHGPTGDADFLKDVVKVTRGFMERDPANVNFNLIALAKGFE